MPEQTTEERSLVDVLKNLGNGAFHAEATEQLAGLVVQMTEFTDLVVPNLDDPKLKTFADLVGGKFATPSDLVQLSRGLQVNVETVVKNAVMTTTGEVTIVYDEQHRDGAGQPIQVANLFTICIPVFYAGELYRIAVRLRYRLVGGRLNWGFQLYRSDLVFDDAFKGIIKTVEDETATTVLLGSPEA